MNKHCTSTFSGPWPRVARAFHTAGARRLGASLSVVALSLAGFAPGLSHASVPLGNRSTAYQLTSIAPAYHGGFWVQLDLSADETGGAGVTLRKGDAEEFENVLYRGSMASIPGRNGYWIVTKDGKIFARGNAKELCDGDLSNCSGYVPGPARGWIVAAAARPSGEGLWALSRAGEVWTAGDAQSYGDVVDEVDTQTIDPTAIVPTPSGLG
jgi:hypothetical protein